MPRSQPWACSPPQVMKESASELAHPPAEGCYIHGLFLEGARWDSFAFQLAESRPKELYTEMAVIWLLPVPSRKPPATGIYLCPIYKTLTRAGRCPEDRPLKTEPIELARTDSPGEAAELFCLLLCTGIGARKNGIVPALVVEWSPHPKILWDGTWGHL